MGVSLVALVLGACGQRRSVVYYEPQPPPAPVAAYQSPPPAPLYQPAPVAAYEPPPPPPTVIVHDEPAWEDVEVDEVVYREYYGCSEEEIAVMPHYRRYYAVDDADLFFVCFVARHARVGFDVAFHEYYYTCGRDNHRLVTMYRIDPAVFFVPLPPQAIYPVVYARPYACYRSRQYAGVAFTNEEYRSLVCLKIGVEYQGQSSEMFFRSAQTCGSPTRVVYIERDRCGQGGRACAGAPLRPTVHPWRLAPAERTEWRAQVGAQHARSETTFRQAHRDQVAVVERAGGNPAHLRPTPSPSQVPHAAASPGGPALRPAPMPDAHPGSADAHGRAPGGSALRPAPMPAAAPGPGDTHGRVPAPSPGIGGDAQGHRRPDAGERNDRPERTGGAGGEPGHRDPPAVYRDPRPGPDRPAQPPPGARMRPADAPRGDRPDEERDGRARGRGQDQNGRDQR